MSSLRSGLWAGRAVCIKAEVGLTLDCLAIKHCLSVCLSLVVWLRWMSCYFRASVAADKTISGNWASTRYISSAQTASGSGVVTEAKGGSCPFP